MRPRNYFIRSYRRRWYVNIINIGIGLMLMGLFINYLFSLGALLLFIGALSHFSDSRKRLKDLQKD